MAKKNVLLRKMGFSFVTAIVVIGSTIGSARDPKVAELLKAPHPQRVDQNIRAHVPAITPPRSPRPQKVYEKAAHTLKQSRNRLKP